MDIAHFRMVRRIAPPLAVACLIAGLSVASSAAATTSPTSLDALVAEALQHNPEIRAARFEYQAALERRAPAGSLDDPMLEFGVVNASLPLSLRREDMTMQMLGLSQKLPFPGKRRLREAVAGSDAEAIGHAADEATNRVVRDLRVVYANLALADRAMVLTGRTQDTLRSLASIAASRYAVGRASEADVLRAGVRSAQIQQDLLRLRTERQVAESEIRRLVGRADTGDVILPMGSGSLAELDASAGDGAQRPQIAALRAMETRGELELALAERDYFPDIELKLGYGHRERSLEGLPRDDMVSITFAVNLPLWRKDRLAPRVAEARALRARAAAMTESQRLETRAGIEQQAARAAEARETLALYRSTLLPQARAATEATRATWEAGGTEFGTVLDATMREYEASLAELTALAAHDRAGAEIDFLTGVAPQPAAATGALP
jgi:outer membrane protein TolC